MDKASRVAVRRLSPPIAPRPCSLALSVTIPVYSTAVFKALRRRRDQVFSHTTGPCIWGLRRCEQRLHQRHVYLRFRPRFVEDGLNREDDSGTSHPVAIGPLRRRLCPPTAT